MQRMMAMEGFILLVLRAPSGTPGEWLYYCTILGRECPGVGQIPMGLAPAMVAVGSVCL